MLVNRQHGIGAHGPMTAGALETAGIEQQDAADLRGPGNMGVAEDDAVDCRKQLQQPVLDGQPVAGPMADADGEPAVCDDLVGRKRRLSLESAHVAMDRMDLLAGESLKNPPVDQVAGMNDDLAVGKRMIDLAMKQVGALRYMGVGKNADVQHDG